MRKKLGRSLVAGGAGFVGSNLVRRLIADGAEVVCVDNLSTGLVDNVSELLDLPSFRFIRGDISDPKVAAELAKTDYASVYDLACPTGVPNIALLGEEMMLASSVGVLNLLKIAKASNARFLFASTAEAYGDPEVVPQPEAYAGNVDPVGPRSPYEEGKRFGEALTTLYARRHGVDARIVRIFNTYGPRMAPHDQRVMPQMIQALLARKPVVIYGDGSQTRTFLHVDDLIEGLLCVMKKGETGTVYNVGGDTEISILQLFELARSVAGVSVRPTFRKHFIADHSRRRPDTARVRGLGWRPKIRLAAGIEECLAAMRLALDTPRPRSSRRRVDGARVTA